MRPNLIMKHKDDTMLLHKFVITNTMKTIFSESDYEKIGNLEIIDITSENQRAVTSIVDWCYSGILKSELDNLESLRDLIQLSENQFLLKSYKKMQPISVIEPPESEEESEQEASEHEQEDSNSDSEMAETDNIPAEFQ